MTKTLPPDPKGMNTDRAEWAAAALRHFQCATGTDDHDAPADLICDLMHWCDRTGLDFEETLARARMHYAAETEAEIPADLLTAAQAALDYLTDHAIDLDGEPEEILAGIRLNLTDTIAKAKGGAA